MRYCCCYYLIFVVLIVIVVWIWWISRKKPGAALILPEKTRDAVRRGARGKPHIESEALPGKIRSTFGDFAPNSGKMWRKSWVRQFDGEIRENLIPAGKVG